MPSGLQTSAKTWGCGQGWRHLRDRLNCPRQSLLQQVSTPPASSPKTWLCPSTWNMMLQFSSWHLKKKKKFHSSNICFQFDPRREAVSFRKSSCYCFLQMWNVSRVAEAGRGKQLQFRWCDNMRKSSKAPKESRFLMQERQWEKNRNLQWVRPSERSGLFLA